MRTISRRQTPRRTTSMLSTAARTVARSSALLALLALAAPLLGSDASAQGPVQTHVNHVLAAWNDTPDGEGLLPAAVAEAETAAQHASLAAGSDELGAMQSHAGHVLHAVAPDRAQGGPGMGYGVIQAAEGVATHVQLAADAEGAANSVVTHARHVRTAAESTVQRAEEVVSLVEEIQAAGSASEAGPLVRELESQAAALVSGEDVDGNGRVSWRSPEGGLEQAEFHMNLLVQQTEGISGPN